MIRFRKAHEKNSSAGINMFISEAEYGRSNDVPILNLETT